MEQFLVELFAVGLVPLVVFKTYWGFSTKEKGNFSR
jgi:hypothetical protein